MLCGMENELIGAPNGSTVPDSVPNPEDWTTVRGAAAILGVNKATVYDLVRRGVLTEYSMFGGYSWGLWVPEVREVAAARARIGK